MIVEVNLEASIVNIAAVDYLAGYLLKTGRDMKRDWDLIRDILIRVEDLPPGDCLQLSESEVDRVEDEHFYLLYEAGFLSADFMRDVRGVAFGVVVGLTWQGHDLLSSIRDEGVWSNVKQRALSVGGQMSIEILKTIATYVAKQTLGIP